MRTQLRKGPLQWGMAWTAWLTYQSERKAEYPGLNFEHAVPEGVQRETVARAVAALVERHEVLRTTFGADENGLPQQTVWSPEPPVLHELDRVADPDGVEGFKNLDFAVDAEWPCRFAIVSEGGDKASLLVCLAHIAVDDHARDVLAHDFGELLESAVSRREPNLHPVACQPLDYALYERSGATSRLRERARQYWLGKLDQIPVATFDTGEIPACVRYVNCSTRSRSAAGRLERIAERTGTSMSAVFSAALIVALSTAISKDVLPLNISSHGRVTGNALDVVAPLARDVIMPVTVHAGQTFGDLAKEIRRSSFEAVRHSMVDTLEFNEWKAIAGAGKGGEIGSRITLNFLHKDNRPGPDDDADWYCEVTRAAEYRGNSHHLYVGATVSPKTLELIVSCSEAVLRRNTIEALARSITDLLGLLDDDPHVDVHHLRHEIAGSFADPASAGRVVTGGDTTSPEALDSVLMRHPAVRKSLTTIDANDLLVTAAEVTQAGLTEADLTAFMKSQRPYRAVLRTLPDRILITPVEESELPRPAAVAAVPAAESALAECVRTANRLSSIDPRLSYVEAGGRFVRIPAVLSLLKNREYEGLGWHDLHLPCSLSVLATRLRSSGDH